MKIESSLATLGEGRRVRDGQIADPVEVPERVLAALSERRPLTVLRAPRGYGKSTALHAFVADIHDAAVVSVSLTKATRSRSGFWSELWRAVRSNRQLLATGQVFGAADDRYRVIATLAEAPFKVVVVIDNYHRAGRDDGSSREIDEDIVDLARSHDHIDVVLATRTRRGVETPGLLSMDGLVIEPQDLSLNGPQVQRLAQSLGITLDGDHSERIAIEAAGCPALIQLGLARSAFGRNGFSPRLLDHYISQTLDDLQLPGVAEFAVRMAVPDGFTLAVAEQLHDSSAHISAGRLLRHLQASGLVHEAVIGTERRYHFSPVVRRALLRIGEERDAAMLRRVHLALLDVAKESNSVLQALTHAVAAGEFEVGVDIINRGWGTLIASAPDQLVQLASKFPQHYWADHSRLRIAANDLRFAPTMRVSATSAEMSATFSAELAEQLRPLLDGHDETPLALMHWGLSNLLLGNIDGAVYAFNRSRNWALSEPDAAAVVHVADVGLAVCHAYAGEPDQALRWLSEEWAAPSVGQDTIVTLADQVARTLALADQGHPDAAEAAAQIVEPLARDDVWSAAVMARGHAAVLSADTKQATTVLNDIRAALRHVPRGSLVEVALSNTLVELLLMTDSIELARDVSARLNIGPIAWAARAKAALADRDYEVALDAARRALVHPRRSWRTALEAHVVSAAARHGLGHEGAAHEAFRRACRIAQATGQRRPFAFMPRFVFEALVVEQPDAADFWPLPSEAVELGEVSTQRPVLTAKELEILRALERHAGPTGIGHELGLSANTVKTHLRAVYRKLNVTNRAEALAAVGGVGR